MLPVEDQMYDVVFPILANSSESVPRHEIRAMLIAWFGITADETSKKKQAGTELLSGRLSFVLSVLDTAGFVHHSIASDQWELTQAGWVFWVNFPHSTRQIIAENSVLYSQRSHHRLINEATVRDLADTHTKISHIQLLNAFRGEMTRREQSLPANQYWNARFQHTIPATQTSTLDNEYHDFSAALNMMPIPHTEAEYYALGGGAG